jgi:zinc protease
MKKLLIVLTAVALIVMYGCTTKEKGDSLTLPIEKYTLENGLDVILHQDHSDPIVSVAIYYHVGSSREEPGKTGFAHLFEHMMFQESENVGQDQFFKLIQGAGGSLNGSTSQDRTNYYEVVPKNALELVLWMESDRMGYLTNTVTKSALANQQNVVQNEKRESVDNAAYGHNSALIARTVYPEGHPYSWTVIGEMEDLTNASIEDVKAFHAKYYIPGNATLVVSGDISKEEVKVLVEKYFGEIAAGEKPAKRSPMPVSIAQTTKLYHEDNFARAPMFTMVFAGAERYSKDSYALNFLADILSATKKSPLYTVLVKDKKLTSRASARNGSQELAGTFSFSVTANPGVSLAEVETSIFEALEKFEKDGFSDTELDRIKAGYETRFVSMFASVQGKAFQLAEYNIYTGNPEYYKTDLEAIRSVTAADIKEAYNKYIKGKNYVATSFVPKGQTNLIADNSVKAEIEEEDVTQASEVVVAAIEEEPVVKTPTSFDRSVQPAIGPDPEVTIPPVWTASMENGMRIFGIEHNELPLVQYQIVIEGGQMADDVLKPGVANLVATLMNEGTKNKTPEELEEAIALLGASISISAGSEDISVRVSSLVSKFEETLALVDEMLLEPRWDEEQFLLAKDRIINGLKRNRANPDYLASSTLSKLIYGDNHIFAYDQQGTEESVAAITIDDLKNYYNSYFSPSTARFIVAGDINQERVTAGLASLTSHWAKKDVVFPALPEVVAPDKSMIYFVDVPGAKQSVISIGAPSIPRSHPDFFGATVANYKLGGSFNGVFNMILREEKGFTYGARSSFSGMKNFGAFTASSRVITKGTLESVNIFKNEMIRYRQGVTQEDIDFTRDALMKSNALRFETLGSLVGMLNTMSLYDLPADYIKQEEAFVKALTVENHQELSSKYIDPMRMYYIVVGDAATQLNDMTKVGFGIPVLLRY